MFFAECKIDPLFELYRLYEQISVSNKTHTPTLQCFFVFRYVSQTCPDEHLIVHKPPLVYDLIKDPFERFALEETQFVLEVRRIRLWLSRICFIANTFQMRALSAQVLREHRESLIPVPGQLGHFDKSVSNHARIWILPL